MKCCGDCPASYTTRTRCSFLEIKYCYFSLRFYKYVRNTGTTTTQPALLFTFLNDLQRTMSLYIRSTDELNPRTVHVPNAVGQAVGSPHQLPFHQCSVLSRPYARFDRDTASSDDENQTKLHICTACIISFNLKRIIRRRGRRRKKLLDDLKDRRGYSHLKEEALDRTMWRNRFRGGFEPVVRQNTE